MFIYEKEYSVYYRSVFLCFSDSNKALALSSIRQQKYYVSLAAYYYRTAEIASIAPVHTKLKVIIFIDLPINGKELLF